MIVLPSFDEFANELDNENRKRIDLLSASILSAPFRAVGPRDRERFDREILVDSLAPLLLGLISHDDRFSILDLGCGVGIPSLFLASFIKGASFTGVDSSQKRVAFGRHLARSTGIGNIEFIESRLSLDLSAGHHDRNALPKRADLVLARAMAKPDLLLPYVISLMQDGLDRFILYSTAASLSVHESILDTIRSQRIEARIHFYRRSEVGARFIAPLLDYALLELIRRGE